jgi:hypothetical protein
MTCRGHYKDFFFTNGFRNVNVLNPGLEVPQEDETGLQLWGPDPVHPPLRRIRQDHRHDLPGDGEEGRSKQEAGGRGETLEAKHNKRPRFEPARPRWIEQAQPETTVQSSYGPWRGARGGRARGRGPDRDRGYI